MSENVLVSFIADKAGEMTDFTIEASFDWDLEAAITKAYRMIDGIWTPAIVDKKPVDSKIYLIIDVVPWEKPSLFVEKSNVMLVEINYFGVKKEKTTKKSVGFKTMRIVSSSFEPGPRTKSSR